MSRKDDYPTFVKRGEGLFPLLDDGRDLMRSIPEGKMVQVHVISPRNIRHHNMFFALLNKMVESGAWSGDIESLKEAIKIETHLVDYYVDLRGEQHIRPRSISFAAMSQEEFNRWFPRAVYVCCKHLLGREDWEWLHKEIIEMVDGPINAQRTRT